MSLLEDAACYLLAFMLTCTGSTDRLVLQGVSAFAKKDYERAAILYSEALGRSGIDLERRRKALRFRADAYHFANKKEQAEADYTAIIRLDPSDARSWRDRAGFYYADDRYDQALADYDHGAQLAPSDGRFAAGKGRVFAAQNRHAEAIPYYDEAIRLNPQSGSFALLRAEAFNLSKQPARALEDYDRAETLGQLVRYEKIRLHAGRGHAKVQLERYAHAIEDFDATLQLSPDHTRALQWRAAALEKAGQSKRAIDDYQQLLRKDPLNEQAAARIQALRAATSAN
jgi:tetratricopeptide (TPR) repeat protein